MSERNYLIGFGERLVEPVKIRSGGRKSHPYTYGEAKKALLPKIMEAVQATFDLPNLACPNDESVLSITLHPAYLAKSYFPQSLLSELGLRSVGSRARYVKPRKVTRKDESGQLALSPELFIAGARSAFKHFFVALDNDALSEQSADHVCRIEDIQALDSSRIKPIEHASDIIDLEVVLHNDLVDDGYILEGFKEFMTSLGLKLDLDKRLPAGGLCFLPLRAPIGLLSSIVDFSFLRVMRAMPRLRVNDTIFRSASVPGNFPVLLPTEDALDPNVRVAVFDGGLSSGSPMTRWCTPRKLAGAGNTIGEALTHGNSVTSALLFGPLSSPSEPERPYSNVDHWCVLDDVSLSNPPDELYEVLRNITDVLNQNEYDFINLSLGPDLPVEDDDPHAWTSVLDSYLSDGKTLLTVAAGNEGEADWDSGNARIQPPADAVNALTIGAADSLCDHWRRASYSSIGPGRSPGYIKPDIVAFGGCKDTPFWVLDENNPTQSSGTWGTSFGAPFALRSGIGLRAHFGQQLSTCAVKALLTHHADPLGHSQREVGHGRLPFDLDDLAVCGPGEAHIVFQGVLPPSQHLRFPVPIPVNGLVGMIDIRATFCFMTTVDPQDALNYTQAGLEVIWRPDTTYDLEDGKSTHKSKSFFQAKNYYTTEAERRTDAHKWETTVSRSRRLRGSSLKDPVFDVKYGAREAGRNAVRPSRIPFALVLTVAGAKNPNLYNDILTRYRTQLQMMRPQVEIPISVRL